MKNISCLIGLFLILIATSCKEKLGETTLSSLSGKNYNNHAQVHSVRFENNQLIIDGEGLNEATGLKIKNDSISFNENFTIESKNDHQIIANGFRDMGIAVGAVMELVISSAHGASSYSVSFELSPNGAAMGDVLVFDGSFWNPQALNGMFYGGIYSGDCNPGGGTQGEYLVMTDASCGNIGDWLVYNGTGWDHIPMSSAGGSSGDLKSDGSVVMAAALNLGVNDINNVSGITLVDGVDITLKASGDVGSNYTLTLPSGPGDNGEVLTTDGSGVLFWSAPGSASNVTTTEIQDGTIIDVDVSAGAGIAQSKILNLESDLASKLRLDGTSAMAGALNMGTNNITNVGTVAGVDVSAMKTDVDANTAWITGANSLSVGLGNVDNLKQMPFSYLDTNTLLGVDDSKVPSQNAVKTYVDNAMASVSSPWGLNGSDIYYSDGRVGINNSGPIAQLDIVSIDDYNPLLAMKTATNSPANDLINIKNSLGTPLFRINNTGRILLSNPTPSATNEAASKSYVDSKQLWSDYGSYILPKTNAAKVGIGIAGTPGSILHVGQASNPVLKLEDTYNSIVGWPTLELTGEGVGSTLGQINFHNHRHANLEPGASEAASVKAVTMTSSVGDTALSFHVSQAGNPFEAMRIINNGNVGIGTLTPGYKLHVNGSVAGTSAYTNLSDIRYKKELAPITNGVEKIRQLQGYYYNWRQEEFPEINFREGQDMGVIAQEV